MYENKIKVGNYVSIEYLLNYISLENLLKIYYETKFPIYRRSKEIKIDKIYRLFSELKYNYYHARDIDIFITVKLYMKLFGYILGNPND